MGYTEGRAPEATKATEYTCNKLIIHLYTKGIDSLRVINQGLIGKMVVDVIFLFLQPHLARIEYVIGIKSLLDRPHNV